MLDPTNTKRRVLVVEDNLDSARTLTFLLRDEGHEVDFAINGYSALAIAEKLNPDVILLDLGLPDFDGCALARRLRRLPNLQNTRIIAVSGRVGDEDQARALAAGCDQFLRKPVSPQTIQTIVAGAIPSSDTKSASVHPLRGA